MKNLNKLPLSVVVTAYNEEKKLADCLESVKWADEIIVVNSSSDDKTVDVAGRYTKHVFTRPNNPMLNVNKNYGFTKAKHEWVLSLDADERVTPELADEIRRIIKNHLDIRNGFWIPRKNILFGKWIQNSIWWPDYQLRLFRRSRGKFPEEHVHEMLTINGETGKTEHPILHLNYETVSQFIYKMETIYTENEVKNIIQSGKNLQWYDAVRMPVGDFLKTFFFQKGYKDGLHGLVLSFLQAFYAEVVFAKVWEKKGFPEYNNDHFLKEVIKEMKKSANEFYYWMLTVMIDSAKNNTKKLYYRVLRKRVYSHLKKQ